MDMPIYGGPLVPAGYFFADPHAHVLREFYGDLQEDIFQRARHAGAVKIVNVATDLASSREALETAMANSDVLSTAGVHPHDASSYDDAAEDELARIYAAGAVAIGEAGLDFHYDHSPREVQALVFRRQAALAARLGAPLIVHSREAWPQTMEILSEISGKTAMVMHCFSGGVEEARQCLDLGCRISLSGALTFPKSHETREVLSFVPRDMLMLETDCPFLAPVPIRGKRNEPALLPRTIDAAAGLLGMGSDELSAILMVNMENFFGPRWNGRVPAECAGTGERNV